MIPFRPFLALALAFFVGGRLGEPFRVQNTCLTRRWIGIDTLSLTRRTFGYPVSRALPRSMRIATALAQGQPRDIGSNNRQGGSLVKVQATDSAEATGSEDVESEADRLHREVFSNEKGFLASAAFNPARARKKEEEEEAERLASEWGSTPDKAKDVIEKTKGDKHLSFQELEKMARELNLSDEQQRAFMLKASMKKLSSVTTIPTRKRKSPAEEAVDERVFASEKGFLKNSKEFKNRMKVGSGVRFDAQGFPVGGEGDPVVAAARKPKPSAESGVEGVSFPSVPDCPRCSAPTMEDELSQFGMCSQCKADEISAVAYSGPAVASKYTYDNGDAPFSSSWTMPTPTKGRGMSSEKPDPERTTATRRSNGNRAAATGGGGGGDTAAAAAAAAVTGNGGGGGGGGGGEGDTSAVRASGGEGSEAVQKLSLEVAELRSLVGATRMELGKRGTGHPGAVGATAAGAAAAAAGAKDGQRDAALRKLARDITELRTDLASVSARDGAVGAREGGTEAVQRLSREVTELRSQLEQSRKEHAMTRTALRRLKDKVDGLAARDAKR